MTFLSFAQNFEDLLLHRVFGGQATGFYVDVGAYHPVNGSVTKAFYDSGWSGINIEPGSVFAELVAARPRDINLRMAVFDRPGEVVFVENEDDRGTSCVSDEAACGGTGQVVPCDTLEGIIRAHGRNRPVDFIKIDAEGAEAAIIRSTDWRRLRPRVLLVEATRPWSSVLANQEWEPGLLEQGYIRVYFDGINCFYVPEEERAFLQRHFDVPVNVLDHVVRHEDQQLRVALNEQIQCTARLTDERDRLRRSLDVQKQEAELIAAERDGLRAALDERAREVASISGELDSLRTALGRRTRPATGTVAAQETSTAFPPAGTGWRIRLRAAIRQTVKLVYLAVRPVIRPIMWRLRGFMTGDLSEQLRLLRERIETSANRGSGGSPVQGQAGKQMADGAGAEMLRLAAAMERTLLTLALERTPDGGSAATPSSTLPPSSPTPRVSLLLPGGRTAAVEYEPNDLSVSASLMASGGDWEPHVRRYLAGIVQPDWVCLDIGANLGAHTLALAVLATAGRVVAFEADAANFRLLKRNAGALAQPHAVIEPVHLALWDHPGTLVSVGADEFAGCTFVAENPGDEAAIEQHLRAVVSPSAMDGVVLRIRRFNVAALPLDHWVEEHALPRLDLIKLDVEGAEVRVIRGADKILRRYQPVLLVEYNPACAAEYFGQPPEALFQELETRFASISALESDGRLTPLADWHALETRLANGKGWEDLVCLPGQPARG